MFGDKNFEEIEIEQIDLDVDKSFDVTIDVSSIGNSIPDLTLEEVSSFDENKGEETKIEEVSVGGEVSEEQEESVSLSTEELESILEGVEVSEVKEVANLEGIEFEFTPQVESNVEVESNLGVSKEEKIEEISEEPTIVSEESGEITGIGEVLKEEGGFEVSGLEEVEITQGSESILDQGVPGEVVSEVKEEESLVILSTDEYNKIVEESEKVPIIDKPLEEVIESQVTEEVGLGEVISPSDLGINEQELSEEESSQKLEIEEFQEIPEEMVISKLEEEEAETNKEIVESVVGGEESFELSSFEELEVKEGEIGGEEIVSSEVGIPGEAFYGEEELSSEESKFELVDDISIEVESATEESSSIMPDELGLEEIQVEEVEVPKMGQEEILGIGFGEKEITTPTTQLTEEIEEVSLEKVEGVSRSGTSETLEVSSTFEEFYEPVSFEETEVISQELKEEKQEKIERALEGLGEQEKEDIRKVLLYLDSLLGSLPEDKIKEFASSEYYDLYVKLFNKLNLK